MVCSLNCRFYGLNSMFKGLLYLPMYIYIVPGYRQGEVHIGCSRGVLFILHPGYVFYYTKTLVDKVYVKSNTEPHRIHDKDTTQKEITNTFHTEPVCYSSIGVISIRPAEDVMNKFKGKKVYWPKCD